MIQALLLAAAALLSCSYKIVEQFAARIAPSQKRYAVYYWGGLLAAVSLIVPDAYVFRLPDHAVFTLPLVLVVLAANLLAAKASGYRPEGRFDRINFVLTYPVLEEAAFRGLVLPLLASLNPPGIGSWELFGIAVGPAVLISALLFAVSHLQYYRVSRQSLIFMLFAFSGGLFFGAIAEHTRSIVLTIPLHIAFNAAALFYSAKARR